MYMATAETIVKAVLRWTLPVSLLAALGGNTVDGIYGASQVWSSPRPTSVSDSPDHRFRAAVIKRKEGYRTRTQIIVQRHFHGFLLSQFDALDSDQPVQIQLKWTGQDRLSIACDRCDLTDMSDRNWGRLHLSYDVGAFAP